MVNNKVYIQRMVETVRLSIEQVKKGGVPFSSLVINKKGTILGKGVNEVSKRCDPTAHAEIMAIREACQNVGTANLSNTILFASGEPCGLCYMAARWAGITDILIAVDREEAASAGFDYRWTYNFFKDGQPTYGVGIQKISVSDPLEPFDIFGNIRGFRDAH